MTTKTAVPAIGPNSGSAQMGAASTSRDQLFAALQDDPSPYELHAGSVIPATLLTGINAELPGTIVAQVRQDVFDSVTGHYLLVPRGTKLIGSYDSRIVQGQHRVMVAWTRLLYPDGSRLDLSGMEGTDPAGYAGFGANVDEHLNKVFNSALLLSIIGGIIGILIGILGGFELTKGIGFPFVFNPFAVALAFGVAAIVGVSFGYYPAVRASKLDPIVALRTE